MVILLVRLEGLGLAPGGMGRCQGRMCGPVLAHLIARATGRPLTDAGVSTPRPPAKSVPLAALAQESH